MGWIAIAKDTEECWTLMNVVIKLDSFYKYCQYVKKAYKTESVYAFTVEHFNWLHQTLQGVPISQA
jgi:hypothetical protein